MKREKCVDPSLRVVWSADWLSVPQDYKILITGGNGFIGSHLANRLLTEGYFVRILDIAPTSKFSGDIADEVMVGNLCNPQDCVRAIHGVHAVFHLAAQMGGMGTIHSENGSQIYRENHEMTMNILSACTLNSSSVKMFFYASSACVYPEALQGLDDQDVSLRESDVIHHPVSPQGLYGLEKYSSENLVSVYCDQNSHHITVRIARFHNVYGPRGSFMDGREKAPAALLRKAHALALSNPRPSEMSMEVWGSGMQRRSFLFIDDAIDAIIRLVRSDVDKPINIGSDHSVTVDELALIALQSAGLDAEHVTLIHNAKRETGVASRNANNDLMKHQLHWEPLVSLGEGMNRTGEWIRGEIESLVARGAVTASDLRVSRVTHLSSEVITFALLLPLLDEGWMRNIHQAFLNLADERHLPHGIGCVAFTDCSFPGMPTFPVLHRTHMDIFQGEVIPPIFINQDGDPFLFQLYRRFGTSLMLSLRLTNSIGGEGDARYIKQSATNWTFDTLDNATNAVEAWLRTEGFSDCRLLTIDVIIPSYRVDLRLIRPMLKLQCSSTATTHFIIIIDDPCARQTAALLSEYSHRPDIRIRINSQNSGASTSRNRGLRESAAEWVLFLDDDVQPSPDILIRLEEVIRKHHNAAGFVGTSNFPPADTIFTAALHLSGVTYFWDIATKWDGSIPWGVTANLASRRVNDGISFDLDFPKTGGGEDIDYCIKRREYSLKHGGEGLLPAREAVVTHPWWLNGHRSYWRFVKWAHGDGALVKKYPNLCYWDYAPNSGELALLITIFAIIETITRLIKGFIVPRAQAFLWLPLLPLEAMKLAVIVIVANLIHDLYRHLYRDAGQICFRTSTQGVHWILAIMESTIIRMLSELGRTVGMVERGEWILLMQRFDWFTNLAGTGPRMNERKNSIQRFGLILAMSYFWFAF
ncbi:glycosyltransferase family 2 protein [Clavulina sp. PMI_390]|nr:glycosyltransferase family 2 protein [Clavulina sp. PMI_390]